MAEPMAELLHGTGRRDRRERNRAPRDRGVKTRIRVGLLQVYKGQSHLGLSNLQRRIAKNQGVIRNVALLRIKYYYALDIGSLLESARKELPRQFISTLESPRVASARQPYFVRSP